MLFLVLREALVVIAIGLAAGVPLAIWAGGRLDQLLYNVSPLDAVSYASATLVLAIVAHRRRAHSRTSRRRARADERAEDRIDQAAGSGLS